MAVPTHAPEKPVGHELNLLMGIESEISGGEQGGVITGLAGQRDADQRIRTTLGQLDKPYDVLYGSAKERLAQSLVLIEKRTNKTAKSDPARSGPSHKPWIWACEKCSDWQCEHRLLTDLLASRLTAA